MLLITHDLAVVAETSDRVVVLYEGRVVEAGPAREIFERPQHAYTRRLVGSILRADKRVPLTAVEEPV
jgi:ABC-type dipeptide/oligopeptide/nickel transport system ATPase component